MTGRQKTPAAQNARRVRYFNGGFLRNRHLRRILQLAGYNLHLGWPRAQDFIAVWGHSPYAVRGETVARLTGAPLLRVEDAWLRSVRPGREGDLPLGLLADQSGMHFNPSRPSDLETLLSRHPLDDPDLLSRSRNAIAAIKAAQLSKYNCFELDTELPEPGFVLVVDQSRDDASVRYGNVDATTFARMLEAARREHPGRKILIKAHPETARGLRQGYFSLSDCDEHTVLFIDPVSPWALFERAHAVYVVSSQLGFEYMLSSGRPQVFGQPFYAGWGLSDDRHDAPLSRRGRMLSVEQLFAAAMILYPIWYDPFSDQLCEVEDVIRNLTPMARAWREDHRGWRAHGMRLWKRRPLQQVFGRYKPVQFSGEPKDRQRHMVWANRVEMAPVGSVRVEDGFVRSRGLGAELIPPMSLVLDDLGIYYDPSEPSRLEAYIAQSVALDDQKLSRAQAVRQMLIEHGLSKYNIGADKIALPPGHRILVPGQVEDDASIRRGAGQKIKKNVDLLRLVRTENPEAVIIYKPHPDVEAGLREGKVSDEDLSLLADAVADQTDPITLLGMADEIWTMTSLMGFEALIRDVPVTTTGAPFYAGWGLTTDLGAVPRRRQGRMVSVDQLLYAVLIDYPRYYDPVTNLPCPVEVVLDRLIHDQLPHPGRANRILSKLQGAFASYAGLWR